MGAKERIMLLMMFWRGDTVDQIAVKLGRTAPSIVVRLHRMHAGERYEVQRVVDLAKEVGCRPKLVHSVATELGLIQRHREFLDAPQRTAVLASLPKRKKKP